MSILVVGSVAYDSVETLETSFLREQVKMIKEAGLTAYFHIDGNPLIMEL